MQTPIPGAVYEDERTGDLLECVHSPDTFGVPVHEAENMQIEFETVEGDDWFTIFVDNFGRGYRKVADSIEDLEADRQ